MRRSRTSVAGPCSSSPTVSRRFCVLRASSTRASMSPIRISQLCSPAASSLARPLASWAYHPTQGRRTTRTICRVLYAINTIEDETRNRDQQFGAVVPSARRIADFTETQIRELRKFLRGPVPEAPIAPPEAPGSRSASEPSPPVGPTVENFVPPPLLAEDLPDQSGAD